MPVVSRLWASAPVQYVTSSVIFRFVVSFLMFMFLPLFGLEKSTVVVPDNTKDSTPQEVTKSSNSAQSNFDETPSSVHEYDSSDYEVHAHPLFPSISNRSFPETPVSDVTELSPSDQSHPQLCSTGLTTRLLPFKNAKGEIEWAFTEDVPGNELDVFKLNTNDHSYKVSNEMNEKTESSDENYDADKMNDDAEDEDLSEAESDDSHHQDKNNSRQGIELSPITSNSSNNESIDSPHSDKKLDHGDFGSPNSSELGSADGDLDVEDGECDGEGDGDKIHHCPHCEATFKIRGYLTRHLKKHADKKAYTCPFHKFSIYIDEHNNTHKCHPNGGFSRRDTYKTHLKSRHFKYPKGVKTKDRPKSSGNCSMCGEFFENAEIWCEIHVEGGECKYLPPGFKGKSRIKNRMRRERIQREKAIQRKMRQQLLRDQKGGPISLNNQRPQQMTQLGMYSQDQSIVAGLDSEYSTPFMDTPKSINTPVQNSEQSPGAYSVHSHHTMVSAGSPTFVQLQHQHQQQQQQTMIQGFGYPQTQMPGHNANQVTSGGYQKQQAIELQYATQQFTPPVLNSLNSSLSTSISHEDYEDEYCLDVDQLTYMPLDAPVQQVTQDVPQRQPSPNMWNYLKAQGSLNYQEVKVDRYM